MPDRTTATQINKTTRSRPPHTLSQAGLRSLANGLLARRIDFCPVENILQGTPAAQADILIIQATLATGTPVTSELFKLKVGT